MSEYEARFGGVGRLVSRAGLARLRAAHVCVIGVGGVGSWVVEALARSGVGELTLVDLDEVCVSNVNRQVPALDGEIGKPKVEVLARRIEAINPECMVHARMEFFTATTAEDILGTKYDYVFDGIDVLSNKCHLIAACVGKGLRIVTAGGAGGRKDPTAVRISDLAFCSHDALLSETRRRLRKEYGFPRDPLTPFQVESVFSSERPVYPQTDGTVCEQRDLTTELRLKCEGGFGTAAFVTGAFGFAGAAQIVRQIAG